MLQAVVWTEDYSFLAALLEVEGEVEVLLHRNQASVEEEVVVGEQTFGRRRREVSMVLGALFRVQLTAEMSFSILFALVVGINPGLVDIELWSCV